MEEKTHFSTSLKRPADPDKTEKGNDNDNDNDSDNDTLYLKRVARNSYRN